MDDGLFISGSFGIPGGVGHALVDLYTALLLSEILHVQYVYNDIETVPIAMYDQNLRGISEHERRHPWDDVFGLRDCFPNRESIAGLYDETMRLAGHGQWSLFNSRDMQNARALVQSYRDDRRRVLFEITNNERLWYWQVVYWEQQGLVDKGTTSRFRNIIRSPFRRTTAATHSHLLKKLRPRVSVHIRNSGLPSLRDRWEDIALQKLGATQIAQWLDVPLDIYSEGQEADLNRICTLYHGVPANIHFNEDTVESFIAMATSDVLLGGKSEFFLHAGLLSPGLKIAGPQYCSAEERAEERMAVDDEWLIVNGELDRDLFVRYFDARDKS